MGLINKVRGTTLELLFLTVSSLFLASCGGGGSTETDVSDSGAASKDTVQLVISKFGAGTITDQDGAQVCDSIRCLINAPSDSSLVLDATPQDGWVLHSWRGCDSVQGNRCEILASANATVHPTFQQSAPITLKSDVIRIPPADYQNLVSRSEDSVTFLDDNLSISSAQVGQVLVSGEGQGFSGRILDIIDQPGVSRTFVYRPVAIDEIIESGSFVLTGSDFPLRAAKITPLSPAVRLGKTSVTEKGAVSLPVTLTLPSYAGIDPDDPLFVRVDGTAILEITPNFAYSPTIFGWPKELKLVFETSSKWDGSVEFGAARTVEQDFRIPFAKIEFIPVLVGGVLLVAPESYLYINFKNEVSGSWRFSVSSTASVDAGIHYLKGSGVDFIGDSSFVSEGLRPEFPVGAEFSSRLGLGVGNKLTVNKVLARLEAKAEVFGEIESSIRPNASQACTDFASSVGARVRLEGDMLSFIEDLADFDITVIESSRPVPLLPEFQSSACEITSQTPAPEVPTAFMITNVQNGSQLSLTWATANSGTRTKFFEIYRDNELVSSTVQETYLDHSLASGRTYCYYVRAVAEGDLRSAPTATKCSATQELANRQPPSAPTNTAATALSSSSVNLAWRVPSDSNYSFRIENSDSGVRLATTSAESFDIDGLMPSTRYCFVVVSVDPISGANKRGLESCSVTLPVDESIAPIAVPTATAISPPDLIANGRTQQLSIIGNAFDTGNVVQYRWSVGSGSGIWTTSRDAASIRSDLITVPINPGYDQDVIQVRVCKSTREILAIHCSSEPLSLTVSPKPSSSIAPSPLHLAPISVLSCHEIVAGFDPATNERVVTTNRTFSSAFQRVGSVIYQDSRQLLDYVDFEPLLSNDGGWRVTREADGSVSYIGQLGFVGFNSFTFKDELVTGWSYVIARHSSYICE